MSGRARQGQWTMQTHGISLVGALHNVICSSRYVINGLYGINILHLTKYLIHSCSGLDISQCGQVETRGRISTCGAALMSSSAALTWLGIYVERLNYSLTYAR